MKSMTTALAGKMFCDGCGLGTTPEHIAQRLRRLELTTRYRPIHIQAAFLSAQSPSDESAFLYGAKDSFAGEAGALLRAAQIETAGRDVETVLAEFQRKGFFLTHVLECIPDGQGIDMLPSDALRQRLPSVIRKIRGSLRPKRVVALSRELQPVLGELTAAEIGAQWVLDGGQPFDLTSSAGVSQLTNALAGL